MFFFRGYKTIPNGELCKAADSEGSSRMNKWLTWQLQNRSKVICFTEGTMTERKCHSDTAEVSIQLTRLCSGSGN